MSSDAIYYVYAYLDPDTREPFYIGKGKNGRALTHLKEARDERIDTKDYYNPIKLSRIRKILEQGMEPIIDYVCEEMTEEDALELEMFLIQEIGRRVLNEGPLTNLTDGGEGFSGLVRDDREYHLYNLVSLEEFKGKRKEIMSTLGFSDSTTSMLIGGRIKRVSDWCLFENKDSLQPECSNIVTHFIHEDGSRENCSFKELARKHDITNNMSSLYNGRYLSLKGWRIDYERDAEFWASMEPATVLHHYQGEEVNGSPKELSSMTGLSLSDILLLLKNQRDSINGWFFKDRLKGKIYKFVHYTGKITIGTITEIAEEVGTSPSTPCAVISGRRSHADWWFYNEIPEDRKKEIDEKFTPRYFTHKDGGTVLMCSVDLAKEYDLVIGKVNEVMRGTRRHTKGWFLGKEVPKDIKGFKIEGGDPTVFTFINVENGETFTGTRVEFSSHSGIHHKAIWKIVNQGSKQKNWKLNE